MFREDVKRDYKILNNSKDYTDDIRLWEELEQTQHQ